MTRRFKGMLGYTFVNKWQCNKRLSCLKQGNMVATPSKDKHQGKTKEIMDLVTQQGKWFHPLQTNYTLLKKIDIPLPWLLGIMTCLKQITALTEALRRAWEQEFNMDWADHSFILSTTVLKTANSKLLTTPDWNYWTLITDRYNCHGYWQPAATSGPKYHPFFYLLFEEEVKAYCKDSKDWIGSPPTGARVQQYSSSETTNPCSLPPNLNPPNPFSLLDCCLFQMVAINSASEHFYKDSRLSPSKFLSLLVSTPTCTLNKAPPPTDYRI